MNTEVKVGAFTLGGLALVMAVFVMLSNISFMGDNDYRISVGFSQSIGLNPGNSVTYAGVHVGSVETISPEGTGVVVKLKIGKDVKIPKKSSFSITSNGVMGEKFINIQPAADADINDCYQDGDYVLGINDVGIDNVMSGINDALKEVHKLLATMNEILGNDQTKDALKAISINLRDITNNINGLTATMANIAVATQDDIRMMARNLNTTTGSLMKAADSVEQLVTTFNGDGETGVNLKTAVKNLSETSKRIDNMASALEKVVTDPKVASDIKETLHNVRSISQRADKMMGKVEGMSVTPGVETMYSGKSGKWITDFDARIGMGNNSFARFGVNDIGEANSIDLQGGMTSGTVGARAGLTESKVGVGLDIYGGKNLKLSVDAFDPNEFKVKSRIQYELGKDTYLFTQVNDINKSDKRATYFGLRREF